MLYAEAVTAALARAEVDGKPVRVWQHVGGRQPGGKPILPQPQRHMVTGWDEPSPRWVWQLRLIAAPTGQSVTQNQTSAALATTLYDKLRAMTPATARTPGLYEAIHAAVTQVVAELPVVGPEIV